MIVLRTSIEDKAILAHRLLTQYFYAIGAEFAIEKFPTHWEVHLVTPDFSLGIEAQISGFAQCIAEHYLKLKSN